MELSKEILQELAKPFPSDRISIKVQTKPNDNGNSLCVAYIDARDVMDRLDSVVGGAWSDTYRNAPSGGLECALTVCGVTRCDVGDDKNENEAEKAGYSDAFKRAAVKFGIGRFLYDLPKMYGKTRPLGKTFVLENGEHERLQRTIEAALGGTKRPSNGNGKKPQVEQPEQETTVTTKEQHKQTTFSGKIAPKDIIDNELAKDIASASWMMNNLMLVNKNLADGLEVCKLYRRWRESGLEAKDAAAKTIAGEVPQAEVV